MAEDLETLKAQLWTQFQRACTCAESGDWGTNESRAANRNAAGTIGLAIVAIQKEERERAEASGPLGLDKPAVQPQIACQQTMPLPIRLKM